MLDGLNIPYPSSLPQARTNRNSRPEEATDPNSGLEEGTATTLRRRNCRRPPRLGRPPQCRTRRPTRYHAALRLDIAIQQRPSSGIQEPGTANLCRYATTATKVGPVGPSLRIHREHGQQCLCTLSSNYHSPTFQFATAVASSCL